MGFVQPHVSRIMRPLTLVLLLSLAACGDKPQEQAKGMQIPVSVVQIAPRAVSVTTELPGRVQAI